MRCTCKEESRIRCAVYFFNPIPLQNRSDNLSEIFIRISSELPELIFSNSKGFTPIIHKDDMFLSAGKGDDIFVYRPKLLEVY